MAKTRLCYQHRNYLNDLAKKLVHAPAEQSAMDAAYSAAAVAISAMVVAKYPIKDMLVLKRYDAARFDQCIFLDDAGGRMRFDFRTEEEAPLVPCRFGCNSRVFVPDPEIRAITDAWNDAVFAHKEALAAKLGDYRSLIAAAKTFEDVVEIWPEAEQLRNVICKGSVALSVVSDDLVARIRADVQARAV